MGLDQYLKAKTKTIPKKSLTGACGGLFPVAPEDGGTTEIGYWRKAYAVSDYLRDTLCVEGIFNCENKEISYDEVVEIINDATEIIEEESYDDMYEKEDWLKVIKSFTKAKEILDKDENATIYYMEWY